MLSKPVTRKVLWDALNEDTRDFIRALMAVQGMELVRIEHGDLVWEKL